MLSVDIEARRGGLQLSAAFTAAGRQVTALFGRSGAGKTTLLQMLAGLSHPDRGQITLNGRVLFSADRGIKLPAHRRRIALLFQDGRLFPHFTVRGNLTYGAGLRQGSALIGFDDVVALLGLAPLLTRLPLHLSGGEKQRVAIGRALLSHPEALLLDEPLNGLDGARKTELLSYIARLTEQLPLPILLVSHAPAEILRVARQLLLVEQGRLLAAGPLETVMNRPEFAAAAGHAGLITVLDARLEANQAGQAASRLRVGDGHITVPRLDLPAGSALRLMIAADQVILSLAPASGLSVRNQLKGRIQSLRPIGELVTVTVDIGCPLQAEVTQDACADLALTPGKEVWALIKTAAIHADAIVPQPGGAPQMQIPG